MPKRKGYILEKIADMDNLRAAADDSQQGGKASRNFYIREFNADRERYLRELQRMILTLDFPKPDYRVTKRVVDCGKTRDIVLADYFPWHVLDHAIMRVIEKDITGSLIMDSFACIKGKGLTFGVQRVKKALRLYDGQFFVKTDFKKFYESISHDLVMRELTRRYKDKKFLTLVDKFVLNYHSDVEKDLEDERRKRTTNRTLYKSAACKRVDQRDRSSCQGETSRPSLLPLLRRYNVAIQNEA